MADANPNARLETFCDGVFAIALTLLIIDIKLPAAASIHNTAEFWLELRRLAPAIVAFVLSFTVILITWVNHHATLKLIERSSAAFIYANGFLLLTVVFIPFPTSLLGEFLRKPGLAGPAVILYDGVLVVQGIGWILVTGAAFRDRLIRDDASAATLRENSKNGYFAIVFYGLLTALAVWFPIAAAIVTTASWIFWLILSIRMKHA